MWAVGARGVLPDVQACEVQIDVLSSGRTVHFPSELALGNQQRLMTKVKDMVRGNFEWPALRRKLDRLLPGYEQ